MFYNEFIELNPPIGTKVRYKDKEWLFVGYSKDHNENKSIELATTENVRSNAIIFEWNDYEFEIIGMPTYKTLPKYKVGDIVYWRYHKCIILEDRNEDNDKYFAYNTVLKCAEDYKENQLFLEPQDQNDENEVEKLEVKGDEQE